MDVTHIVMSIFVVIFIVVSIRYLYRWLTNASDLQDVVIFSPAGKSGFVANNGATTISVNNHALTTDTGTGNAPPPLYAGGEFSVSTWIYINNWGYSSTYNKVFLTLSGNGAAASGFNTLVMYLGKSTNKLGVRVSTSTTTLNATAMGLINQNGGADPYIDTNFKMCDIDSIDLQRWVNITTVVSGRTIDVYIDGKLARSCVLDSLFMVESGINNTIVLGGASRTGANTSAVGFGGYIGQTRMANFAYSPDYIYSSYLNGPFTTSIVGQLLGMFGVNITANMPTIPITITTPPA